MRVKGSWRPRLSHWGFRLPGWGRGARGLRRLVSGQEKVQVEAGPPVMQVAARVPLERAKARVSHSQRCDGARDLPRPLLEF